MIQAEHANPYEPPAAEADYDLAEPLSTPLHAPLATLWQRWLGALIDSGIYVVAGAPGMLMASSPHLSRNLVAVIVALGLTPIAAVQAYFVTRSGQSIGKKVLNIRIVRQDGSLPGFVYGVLLRSWLIGAMGLVPLIGAFFALMDALLVFRADRRCLHDLVAGTSVVQA